jgi:hypothetical protein
MFYTVFSTNLAPRIQWQSDLLEYSWRRVAQEGVLVRLVATDDPGKLPQQKYAECVATRCWDSHPDTGDAYPIYNKPASLLEWLFRDRPEGTVLLIDPDCIFRAPLNRHVAPGFPVAQDWVNQPMRKPGSRYPFGLPAEFAFLNDHCARVDLSTTAVMIPTLIHTSDLRKVCARWLELCGIVRQYCRNSQGLPIWEADMYAYLVACAEYRLQHEPASLGICTNWRPQDAPEAPIVHYCQAIFDRDGHEIFSKFSYQPWTRIDTLGEPELDYSRDLVAIINDYVDETNGKLGKITFNQRPRRREGVMEGRVLDEILLEVPSEGRSIWVNASGKVTWDLFDGELTIGQIKSELARRFQADERKVGADVISLVEQLHQYGYLEIR